jgi:hypothetical protein
MEGGREPGTNKAQSTQSVHHKEMVPRSVQLVEGFGKPNKSTRTGGGRGVRVTARSALEFTCTSKGVCTLAPRATRASTQAAAPASTAANNGVFWGRTGESVSHPVLGSVASCFVARRSIIKKYLGWGHDGAEVHQYIHNLHVPPSCSKEQRARTQLYVVVMVIGGYEGGAQRETGRIYTGVTTLWQRRGWWGGGGTQ